MAYLFETEGIYILLALLALPLISIIFNTVKRSLSLNNSSFPPGPTPWPILGNIPHLGNMAHVSLANFAQIHGPLISLRLGAKYMVVGSSPAAAIEILKTCDRSLSGRHVPHAMPHSRSELQNITLIWAEKCDDRWKYFRTLCRTELFSNKALESQECLRGKKVTELVEFVKDNEGNVIDIGNLAFTTNFNILSNIFLSRDLVSLREENACSLMKVKVKELLEVNSAPNISDFYPVLRELDLQGLRKKAKKLFIRFCSMWKPIVEEKRNMKSQTSSSQRDFLDTLVHHNFSDDGISELILELFVAGTDTSTLIVEWMMSELVKNPEAMKKVREELDKETNLDQLKESQLVNLPYLQACYKETLRLHPPAPLLLPRRAPETCQVMNYTVPKDALILVNVWAIGRDPEVWDEPLKFNPERFLNSSLDLKGNNFEFLPFGAGRRICPGLPMAARHIPLVVASLILLYEWSLPDGKTPNELNMNEKFDFTLQREHPLLLIPHARK